MVSVHVDEILNLSSFRGSQVVAGNEGISRVVTSITVGELPDTPDWLVGGELVLTTGYYMKDDVGKQCKWLKELIESGVSALCIKPGRFMGKISEELKELADCYKFPVIELPISSYWAILIKDVTEHIQDYQKSIIHRTENIHNRLTEIVLEGGGVQTIVNTLSELSENPIILEDCLFNTIAIGQHETSMEEDFIAYRQSKEYKRRFKQKREVKELIKNRVKKLIYHQFDNKEESFRQVTIPIIANQVLYGFISLIEKNKKMKHIDRIALEHGATTVALELMKTRVSIENDRRVRNLIITELLEGNIDHAMASYSKLGEGNIFKSSIVILLKFPGFNQMWVDQSNENFFIENLEDKLIREVRKHYLGKNSDAVVNINGDVCLVIYHYPQDLSPKSALYKAKEITKDVIKDLTKNFSISSTFAGIGEPSIELSSISHSYQTALKALKLSEKFLSDSPIAVYDELGIMRILSLINDQKELEHFCQEMIGPLINHDNDKDDQMCETLDIFLKTNGNISESSKILHVHPNTLSYRIRKIKSIINKDIYDAQVRHQLYLALMIKKTIVNQTKSIRSHKKKASF